jgi:23S rRNA (cytosine1962-C5)-methyltransferase
MIRAMGDFGDDRIELVDAGDGRRLERFGAVVVDRPAPAANFWQRDPEAWRAADLRFDPELGWSGRAGSDAGAISPWQVRIGDLTMELRPTSSGGLGLYPEHLANSLRLALDVAERGRATERPPAVLNLFAHTGVHTLTAARAGASVAHVDSARTVVAWARRNAELSGLADRPIRWLVDDAAAFVAREGRRGRRYDGIVLDPPSYGHGHGRGRGGRRWRLADELVALLEGCAAVLADDGFVLLTAHTTGIGGRELEESVGAAFPSVVRVEASPLQIVAGSGAALDLGWSVRVVAG